MGLFNFVKRSAGNIFRGVRDTGKKVLGSAVKGLRGVARGITKVIDPINEAGKKIAQKLNVNIPLVGNPLERLKQIPVFGKAFRILAATSNGIDAIEEFGKGNDKKALEGMKSVAKNAGPKNARRIMKLVDRLT